jgi:hypothetical protein
VTGRTTGSSAAEPDWGTGPGLWQATAALGWLAGYPLIPVPALPPDDRRHLDGAGETTGTLMNGDGFAARKLPSLRRGTRPFQRQRAPLAGEHTSGDSSGRGTTLPPDAVTRPGPLMRLSAADD